MILVDTSVWVDHLRRNEPELANRLEAGRTLAHPYVIGELSLETYSSVKRFWMHFTTSPKLTPQPIGRCSSSSSSMLFSGSASLTSTLISWRRPV